MQNNHNLAAGTFQADGELGKGGYIDFAGPEAYAWQQQQIFQPWGASPGGKVRIGGEYLGGQKLSTVSQRRI